MQHALPTDSAVARQRRRADATRRVKQRAQRQHPGDARIVQAAQPHRPQTQPSVRGGSGLAVLAAADRRTDARSPATSTPEHPGAAHQLLNLLKLSFDKGQERQGKALARKRSKNGKGRTAAAACAERRDHGKVKNLVACKLGLAFLLLVCSLSFRSAPSSASTA